MLYERHNSWFVYVLTHVWKTISLFWKINTFQYGYPGVNSSQYLNEFLVWKSKLQKNFYSSWNFLYIHHKYIFSKQILDSEGIHNLQLFNVEFKKLPVYVKKGRFGHHVISDIQNLVYKRFHGFKIPLYHTRNTYLTLIGPKK